MNLLNLLLIHRYNAVAIHYVAATQDNRFLADRMKAHGLFEDVKLAGDVIVADVDRESVGQLVADDRGALGKLIERRIELGGGLPTI